MDSRRPETQFNRTSLQRPTVKPGNPPPQRDIPSATDAEAASGEQQLVNRIIRGDTEALAEMFSRFRPTLWRMVNFRLHPQLQGRIDVDDVLQDSWLKAVDQMSRFLTDASRSCFVWFRMIVSQTLIDLHRRHLGAAKRSAVREFSIHGGWSPKSTSHSIAFQLLGRLSSPSKAALRAELSQQLDAALQGMNEVDREVLALRHFEELSNAETAQILDMSEQAASARYIRALARLRKVLETLSYFEGNAAPHADE